MATQSEALIIDLQTKNEEKVKNIRTQIREATQDVASLTQKYGEFDDRTKQALKKLADLKDIQGDINDRVKALSPDRFERIAAVGQGLVGGFQTFSGILGAVGVKSEDWEQTMIRLQSLVNISQGLQSFKQFYEVMKVSNVQVGIMGTLQKANAVATNLAAGAMKLFGVATETTSTSFKVLKGAIAATGIGLLVVAIGEAVSYMNSLGDAAEETGKKIERSMKFIDDVQKKNDVQMRVEMAQAKQRGATEEELAAIQVRFAKRRISLIQDEMKGQEDKTKYIELLEEERAKAEEYWAGVADRRRQQQKAAQEQATAAYLKQIEEQKAAQAAWQQVLDELAQEQADREQAAQAAIADIHREQTLLYADEFDKRRFELEEWYTKQREILIAGAASADEVINLDALRAEKKQQILNDELAAIEAQHDAIAIANEEANAAQMKADEEAANQKRAYLTMMYNMELNAAAGLASNLSQLFGQQTKEGKAFALADVAISEGRALASALANAQAPTPDNVASGGLAGIVKFLTIAASITSTAVRARNIIKSGTSNGQNSGLNAAAPALERSTVSTFGSRNLSGGTQTGMSGEYGNTVLVVESLNSVTRRMKRTTQVSSME